MSARLSRKIKRNIGVPKKRAADRLKRNHKKMLKFNQEYLEASLTKLGMNIIEEMAYAEDIMWDFRHAKPGDMVPMTENEFDWI